MVNRSNSRGTIGTSFSLFKCVSFGTLSFRISDVGLWAKNFGNLLKNTTIEKVNCFLTHTLTHTGKGRYGTNGTKSAADLILLEQKGPESVETQGLEGSQSVGKDEVGGSNPPSSSRKSPAISMIAGLSLFAGWAWNSQILRFGYRLATILSAAPFWKAVSAVFQKAGGLKKHFFCPCLRKFQPLRKGIGCIPLCVGFVDIGVFRGCVSNRDL